ncbi:MAG: tRNA pseudouridine(55) synthase TruB [Actinomycetaceae bacterium]|nr:tRNA pseudouridine(55) synthase TruB [Actinomycetaceae bacterium]
MAKRPDTSIPGLLIIDKPAGMTSHDVVSRVRRLARTRKVGHAGTLDPMATGVLVLGIGKATRLLTYITGNSKAYRATMRLGVETHSEDREGEVTATRGCAELDAETLEAALADLRGEIQQVPSAVSALKVGGVRAHALVRGGHEVKLEARPVTIHRLERVGQLRSSTLTIDEGGAPATIPVVDVDIEVECSSGTYVRALARDIGEKLGCGAHLTALRRTRVGTFPVADALVLADLEAAHGPDTEPLIAPISLEAALSALFPQLVLSEPEVQRFAHGNPPRREGEDYARLTDASKGGPIGVFSPEGAALGLLRCQDGQLRTILVF